MNNKQPDPIKYFFTALGLIGALLAGALVFLIQYASRW